MESAAEPKAGCGSAFVCRGLEPLHKICTCLAYPVVVGRSAQTPTCESLCAPVEIKSHRRRTVEVWVAFLLGVLIDPHTEA